MQPKPQSANLMKGVNNQKVNHVKRGLLRMIDPDIEIKRKQMQTEEKKLSSSPKVSSK